MLFYRRVAVGNQTPKMPAITLMTVGSLALPMRPVRVLPPPKLAPIQLSETSFPLSKLMGDITPVIAYFKSRQVVTVVGLTGVGKTLWTKYCAGGHVFWTENGLDCGQRPSFQGAVRAGSVGHDYVAVTLDPIPYEVQVGGESILLADFPGYKDNRVMDYRFRTGLSGFLCTRSASQIRAVLFVFEYGSLTVSRGDGLRDALHSLAEYLPEDLIFFPKIVTVVTKCDAGFSTDKMLEQLARFSKSLTDPQAAQVMTVLLKSSIILFDPMDRGEGRRFVLDQILGARPISSDQFRFTADYETKQHLNGLCNVVVTTYSAVIAQIQLKLISYLRRCEALLPVEADYLKINAELDALPKSVEERLAQIDLDIKETDLKIGEMATKHAVSLLEDEELDHRPSQQRRQPNHRYRETLEERIGEADRRQSQNRLNYDRCKEILANQVRDLAQKLEAIRPEYDRLNKEKEQARENLQTYIEYHQSEMKEFQLISMLYGYGVLSEPSREVKKLLGIMELLSNSLNS